MIKYNGNMHVTSICPVKPISEEIDFIGMLSHSRSICVIRVIYGLTEHCRFFIVKLKGVGGLGCGL